MRPTRNLAPCLSGAITKAGGGFKTDHPLAPAGKYLYHSFVESPDMKNIYDGTVVTDADGRAVVELDNATPPAAADEPES